MLSGDYDSVDSYWLAILIGYGYLSLAIRAQILQGSVLSYLCQTAGQAVCQRYWQWQILRGLAGCITKHHALVASTSCLSFIHRTLASLQSLVNAHSDVRGLLIKRNVDAAGVCIKAVLCTGIADVPDSVAYNLGNVDVAAGGNLASNMSLTSGYQGLTGYAAHRVLCQYCVQDAVRNLVSDFVWMAFSNRFRSKK